jgi:hypothetical protein
VGPKANLDPGEQKINVFLAGSFIMVTMNTKVTSISMKVTSCIWINSGSVNSKHDIDADRK